MCGLLSMLTAKGNAAEFVNAVEGSLECMYHRGPDAAGTWNDNDAVFGFNRLSIIDLEHSHQPLRWGQKTIQNAMPSPSMVKFITISSCARSSRVTDTPSIPKVTVNQSSLAT